VSRGENKCGVPYYAAGWQEVNGGINGLFGTSSKPLSSTQFHYINSLLKSPDLGFTRYWDEYAMVPYLWNPESATFYSYEDEFPLKINVIMSLKTILEE